MSDQLYIAWTRFQRRAETMRDVFEYRLCYVRSPYHHPISKLLLGYPRQIVETWKLLHCAAGVIWLQLPPTFLLHIVLLYRLVSRRSFKLIADVHNAGFNRLWVKFPFTIELLNRADVIIVHNQTVRADALRKGVRSDRLLVLEDRVPEFIAQQRDQMNGRRKVVMPGSFRGDEPIQQVIEAARLAPEIDFVITGSTERATSKGLLSDQPSNVFFPGFLSETDFNHLLLSASAILCLTSRDGIQLSAAVEALGAGKPMIVSDTPLLRQLFADAAIFVENEASTIAAVCREAILNYDLYASATDRLKKSPSRLARWSAQVEHVMAMIG